MTICLPIKFSSQALATLNTTKTRENLAPQLVQGTIEAIIHSIGSKTIEEADCYDVLIGREHYWTSIKSEIHSSYLKVESVSIRSWETVKKHHEKAPQTQALFISELETMRGPNEIIRVLSDDDSWKSIRNKKHQIFEEEETEESTSLPIKFSETSFAQLTSIQTNDNLDQKTIEKVIESIWTKAKKHNYYHVLLKNKHYLARLEAKIRPAFLKINNFVFQSWENLHNNHPTTYFSTKSLFIAALENERGNNGIIDIQTQGSSGQITANIISREIWIGSTLFTLSTEMFNRLTNKDLPDHIIDIDTLKKCLKKIKNNHQNKTKQLSLYFNVDERILNIVVYPEVKTKNHMKILTAYYPAENMIKDRNNLRSDTAFNEWKSRIAQINSQPVEPLPPVG